MATVIDWKLIVKDKEYFCQQSDTLGIFISPLFTNLDDFRKWFGQEPEFEYDSIIIQEEDFSSARNGVEKLKQGAKPEKKEMDSVFELFDLCFKLGESQISLVNELSIFGKIEELDIDKTEYKKNYQSIHDLVYKESIVGIDDPKYLQLAGWYIDEVFKARHALENIPFEEIYNMNVKIKR